MSIKAMHITLLALLVASPLAQATVVNVNQANVDVLVESLEGIGPKKAQAIVAYRKSNGAYQSVDDLLNVKGIGEKILERNRQDILLSKNLSAETSRPKALASTDVSEPKEVALSESAEEPSKPLGATKAGKKAVGKSKEKDML